MRVTMQRAKKRCLQARGPFVGTRERNGGGKISKTDKEWLCRKTSGKKKRNGGSHEKARAFFVGPSPSLPSRMRCSLPPCGRDSYILRSLSKAPAFLLQASSPPSRIFPIGETAFARQTTFSNTYVVRAY